MIFILTDDLDFASVQNMPEIRSQLIEKGLSFEKTFVSHPICCPSRVTILTSLYDHNLDVKGNTVEYHNGDKELYDLEADPYEPESLHEGADPSLIEDLKIKLEALRSCSKRGCKEAEDGRSGLVPTLLSALSRQYRYIWF